MSLLHDRSQKTMLPALFAVSIVGLPAAQCGSSPDPSGSWPHARAAGVASDEADAGAAAPTESSPSTPAVDGGSPVAAITTDSGGGGRDAGGPVDATAAPTVTSVSLLDTSITNVLGGSPVTGFDPMKNASTISAAAVGALLSIRANTPAVLGSAEFNLDGTKHTENGAPYTLCGDNGGGTITNCNITLGAHSLTVTPYSAANLGGTAGTPLTVTFTLDP